MNLVKTQKVRTRITDLGVVQKDKPAASTPSKTVRNIAIAIVFVIIFAAVGYWYTTDPSAKVIIDNPSPTATFITTRTIQVSGIASTTTSYVTTTVTTTLQILQTLPKSVQVVGIAKSNGLGTTAAQIDFIDAENANNKIVSQIDAQGHYTVALPNTSTNPSVPQAYVVIIHYNQSPVGASQCSPGIVVLSTTVTQMTVNFNC